MLKANHVLLCTILLLGTRFSQEVEGFQEYSAEDGVEENIENPDFEQEIPIGQPPIDIPKTDDGSLPRLPSKIDPDKPQVVQINRGTYVSGVPLQKVFTIEDSEKKGTKPSSNQQKYDDSETQPIVLQERLKKLFFLLDDRQQIDFSGAPAGISLTTDKLVYKPGETIIAQAYFYDKYDKSPKTLGKVTADYKLVLKSDGDYFAAIVDDFTQESSVLVFSVPLRDTQSGGQYLLQLTDNFEDVLQSQTVFVLGVDSPSEMLLVDLERDQVLLGETLRGKVSLRVLGRSVDSRALAGLPVEVMLSDGSRRLAQTSAETDATGSIEFAFELTQDQFGELDEVTLSAVLEFGKRKLANAKRVMVTNLGSVECDIEPVSRLVYDREVDLYVQCFTTSRRNHEYPFRNAQIARESFRGSVSDVVKQGVSTNQSGIGRFSVTMKQKYNYYLLLKQGRFTKRVSMPSPTRGLRGDFLMQLGKTVLTQDDSLSVEVLTQNPGSSSVYMVVQDKMKVLTQSKITLEQVPKSTNEDSRGLSKKRGRLVLPVSELNLPSGGILAVQLFSMQDEFNEALAEKLIYVHPAARLKFKVSGSQQVYHPGDEAVFTFDVEGEAPENVLWQVMVTDESGFLRIDRKRHPPSLVTKVFLENELYFPKSDAAALTLNERFENAWQYIDWFFANEQLADDPDRGLLLEYLLLTQEKQRRLLSPKKLFDFLVNKNPIADAEKKRLYKYLLASDFDRMSKKFQQMKEHFEDREKISFDRILTLYDAEKAVRNLKVMSLNSARGPRGFSMDSIAEAETMSSYSISSRASKMASSSQPATPQNVEALLSKDTLIFSALGTNSQSSEIRFTIPNHVGKFRFRVIGVTPDGTYGTYTSTIQLQKRFNARAALPSFLRLNDSLSIPITIENNTE